MAVSKIFYLSENRGKGNRHQYLYNSIKYILNPIKTEGKYVSAINCLPNLEMSYQQMIDTKKAYEKLDGRQGYHLIISFPKDFEDKELGFEIIREFVAEYLGAEYEAIYSLHTDKDHIHGHIVFNSVKFTGNTVSKYFKYRYEKGDWEEEIQPIIDRLCTERGLKPLDYYVREEKEADKRQNKVSYLNTDCTGKNKLPTLGRNSGIKQDVDFAIEQASSYSEFLMILRQKYEVKQGKYLSLKSKDMDRARRLGKIGRQGSTEELSEGYTIEDIKQKISNHKMSDHNQGVDHYNKSQERIMLWDMRKQGPFQCAKMYQYDLDEAIDHSKSFQEVVQRLQSIGYQVIQREDDLLIKGEGIYRYIPSSDLGKLYSLNMIRQRLTDNKALLHNQSNFAGVKSIRIQRVQYKAYLFRRSKLTNFERKRMSALYRLGVIKRSSYSQYWKYKDQIKTFRKLQEEYLFIHENGITSYADIDLVFSKLKEERKECNKKKRRLTDKMVSNEAIYQLFQKMQDKKVAFDLYQNADMTFIEDAKVYISCQETLKQLGYTYDEVKHIIETEQMELEDIRKRKREIARNIRIVKSVFDSKDKQREKIELVKQNKNCIETKER